MIGPGTTIRGHVSGDEDLNVHGTIEGSVRTSKRLTISASAALKAEVEAQSVEVAGRVAGNVTARDGIVLESGAVVRGDLTTTRLVIEDGVRFSGRVNMPVDIPGAKPPGDAKETKTWPTR